MMHGWMMGCMNGPVGWLIGLDIIRKVKMDGWMDGYDNINKRTQTHHAFLIKQIQHSHLDLNHVNTWLFVIETNQIGRNLLFYLQLPYR